MKYTKYDLGSYNLYTVVTDRFKTISLSINIRLQNEKEHDKYMPMLWRMLINTSSHYNSLKEINEAAVSIYDPYYSIRFVGSGLQDTLCLSASFINEKYTERGMNEKSIKFLSDFIFKPKINNEMFDEEMFEIQKAKLIDYYISVKDYPREYAESRIHEEMNFFGYKEYSLDEIIEITKKLTNKELYNFYKKLINEGKLDIFICGNFDPEEIRKIVKKNIEFNGNNEQKPKHIIEQNTYNKKPRVIIETSDNVQSILIIGSKAINMTSFERKYVSLLYSWILGGGTNSLLNQRVREKNSLCYYIYTNRKNLIGDFKIYAGINGEDFDKVYSLIKDELNNVKKGNFTNSLLDSVKHTYYHTLKSIEDYQNDMINSTISEVLVDTDDIKTRRKMMEKVTKEDIMNFAKKVHIDTVYLLKGDRKWKKKHMKNLI